MSKNDAYQGVMSAERMIQELKSDKVSIRSQVKAAPPLNSQIQWMGNLSKKEEAVEH